MQKGWRIRSSVVVLMGTEAWCLWLFRTVADASCTVCGLCCQRAETRPDAAESPTFDDQRHGRGQRRPKPYPSSVGMVLQGPCVPRVLELLVLQVKLLAAYETAVHHADEWTHTRMGRKSRAGEGVES
jgi:hypothetical protein